MLVTDYLEMKGLAHRAAELGTNLARSVNLKIDSCSKRPIRRTFLNGGLLYFSWGHSIEKYVNR